MRFALILSTATAGFSSALGAEGLDIGGSWRVRYEHAAQQALPEDSDALTLRLAGFVRYEPESWLSVFAELEGVAAAGEFDDGEGGVEARPVIPDPAGLEINRAFVEVRPVASATVRFGRQSIKNADERFVGTVAFRQNHQSYDGLRGLFSGPFGLTVDAAQVVGVNRPLGLRGQDRSIDSDSFLLRAELPTPIGTLGAFRYDLDLGRTRSEPIIQGGDALTFGADLQGSYGGDKVGVSYRAALAEQDNRRTRDVTSYRQAGAAFRLGPVEIGYAFERLGAGEEAFQTPLGTNHAFQGDADLFLVTPIGGIEDQALSARWMIGDLGPLKGVAVRARAHRFDPAGEGRRYGDELDLGVAGKWRSIALSLARADYRAAGFGSDTERWWLTAGKSF